MSMITIDVPNLDGEIDAEQLIEFARHLHLLAHYSNCKASAMVSREVGMINAAIRFEKMCDNAYRELPQKWRW